jgi:hypothetical protein
MTLVMLMMAVALLPLLLWPASAEWKWLLWPERSLPCRSAWRVLVVALGEVTDAARCFARIIDIRPCRGLAGDDISLHKTPLLRGFCAFKY